MQVEFYCGPFNIIEEFEDGTQDDVINEAFEDWVMSRSDVGWNYVRDEDAD